jgi:hypothetical protein
MQDASMESALSSLRDVQGVIGSFLIDEHGTLLARDMPAMFDDEVLRSAGERLGRLRAAFENDAERFEGCTARFGAHLLFLRAAEARTLCVLCPTSTNRIMLEMGLNLVARRVAAPKSPVPFMPPRTEAPRPPQGAGQQGVPHVVPSPRVAPRAVAPLAPAPRLAEAPSLDESLLDEDLEPPPTRFFRGRPVR